MPHVGRVWATCMVQQILQAFGGNLCDASWRSVECVRYCASSLAGKCCIHHGVQATFMVPNWAAATKGVTELAAGFTNCTGGVLRWGSRPSKSNWPFEVEADIGNNNVAGPGLYDGYWIKTIWFPSFSARLEDLNDRVRNVAEVDWMDINMQPRREATFQGKVKALPYEADFAHLLVREDLLFAHEAGLKAALGISDQQWDPSLLPQTYEDLAIMAEYFDGRDLNNDTQADYGLCWPIQDYAWVFQFYGIVASKLQYLGAQQGLFFDTTTFDPLVDNPAFHEALVLFRRLIYASHTPVIGKNSLKESNQLFAAGRCAFYLAKRGGLKYSAIRKVTTAGGTWMPRRSNGQYWPPQRRKSLGSISVFNRAVGQMQTCTSDESLVSATYVRCPDVNEYTDSKRGSNYVVNRSPFFGTGVLAGTIRKDADPRRKSLLFDFLVFANVPAQSTKYVAEIGTWDSFRKSQSDNSSYYLGTAGWGQQEYDQMRSIVSWGLSANSNPSMDLRVQGTTEYQYDILVKALVQYCFPVQDLDCKNGRECECRLEGNDVQSCKGVINMSKVTVAASRPCTARKLGFNEECGGLKTLNQTVSYIRRSWDAVTRKYGRLNQVELLRQDLQLPPLDRKALCLHHQVDADSRQPGICTLNCGPGMKKAANGQCVTCPVGTYNTGMNGANQTQCQACPTGTYNNETGQSGCIYCPVGSYQPAKASQKCLLCDSFFAGSTTNMQRVDSSKYCMCPENTFNQSRHNGIASCEKCPEGVDCPGFNEGATLKKGYYSENGIIDFANGVWKCMSLKSCPGQQYPGDDPCCVGGTGLNCGICRDGFFRIDGKCQACDGSGCILPMCLVGCFFAGLVFHYMWSHRPAHVEAAETVAISITVGITLTFLQTLGVFHRTVVNWPREFSDAMEWFSILIFEFGMLRTACTIRPSFAGEYSMRMACPILIVAIFVAWLLLSKAINRLVPRFPSFQIASILNSIGMVLQIFYISIVSVTVNFVECYPSPNGEKALRAFPYTKCGSSQHLSLLPVFIGGALFFVLGLFCFWCWLAIIAPKEYMREEFRIMIRHLVYKFRPDKYWFGIYLTVRSAALAMVTVISPDNGYVQFFFLQSILAIGLVAHLTHLPYADKYANQLETFEICMLMCILGAGVWFIEDRNFYVASNIGTSTMFSILLYACLAICVIALACVFAWALYLATFPDRARAMHKHEVDATVPQLRAMCMVITAASSEELRDLLHIGSYVERWHVQQMMNFIMLELCGLRTREIMGRRLPYHIHDIVDATPENLEKTESRALSRIGQSFTSTTQLDRHGTSSPSSETDQRLTPDQRLTLTSSLPLTLTSKVEDSVSEASGDQRLQQEASSFQETIHRIAQKPRYECLSIARPSHVFSL